MAEPTSVRVAVRVRPLNAREKVDRCSECVNVLEEDTQVVIGKQRSFTYDYVFGQYCAQTDIFEQCVVGLIDSLFDGYNATIFAYGQTGSGKTYTMGTSASLHTFEEEKGVVPRVMVDLYDRIEKGKAENPGVSYALKVQFLEVYGESIRDLLDATAVLGGVQIREMENGELRIDNAKEEVVNAVDEMNMLLEKGTLCRTTGSTRMNAHSSRSHAIFTFILQQVLPPLEGTQDASSTNAAGSMDIFKDDGCEVRLSKFHFVDLAGSERAKRTQATGKRLKEGIDINKGLLALGNVISALGDDKKRGKVHVPYRDSKLTRMLQDSLGGNRWQ